ncbi:hypothetical protein ACTTAM_11080 [Rhodobacter capsulatus]|uniref:hypothetical protein n=1 Tax=Rhodobacter capsulatus TaxID=1061 RepID=UPI004029FC9C
MRLRETRAQAVQKGAQRRRGAAALHPGQGVIQRGQARVRAGVDAQDLARLGGDHQPALDILGDEGDGAAQKIGAAARPGAAQKIGPAATGDLQRDRSPRQPGSGGIGAR